MFNGLSLWRLQNAMNSGGGAGNGGDDYSPFALLDDDTRRRAADAGRSALLAGMLNAYMNRGRGVGDAFTAMSTARQGVLDRELEQRRLRAYDERQRRSDASLEASRHVEAENKRIDNERAQREVDARAAEAEAKHKAAEAEQARVVAQRERLLKDNPAAANYSDKQVEDEYGKRYGYHEPDKPQEISPGAYLRDPRTGDIIYHAPERPERDKPPTPAELRAERGEEQRQIKARQDELYDEWLAALSSVQVYGLTEADKAKAKLNARHQAEKELGGADTTTLHGGNKGTSASARLESVTDAVTKHKIAVARSHNYTDEQIAEFLGL